jgi:hypothetical protein
MIRAVVDYFKDQLAMSGYVPNINIILDQDRVRISPRGSPMGSNRLIEDLSMPLLVQRIEMVDGDYGADGIYWGAGRIPLWCAFNPDTSEYKAGMGTRIYVRASSFDEAVQLAQKAAPSASFASEEDSEPSEEFDPYAGEMDDDENEAEGAEGRSNRI